MKGTPSAIHSELLLRMMAYLLTLDQRATLMREIPEAYNALVGWRVVTTLPTTADGGPRPRSDKQ